MIYSLIARLAELGPLLPPDEAYAEIYAEVINRALALARRGRGRLWGGHGPMLSRHKGTLHWHFPLN